MKRSSITGLLLFLYATAAWPQAMVATAEAIEGTVYVTRLDGRQGLMSRGASLQQGETIHTARNSSVRLKLADGGETVIRPESSLLVRDFFYKIEAPEKDSLLLQLIKGGLRAVTGAIGKRGSQNAYKLQVATATVGIRGTDFSARLCDKDCADPQRSVQSNRTTPVAARVVKLVGEVSLTRGARPWPMTPETPVYIGDVVETGPSSHVVLVFRDNARLTVNPSTRFELTRYNYDTASGAEPPSMFIDLLKGGLRFATGLIGKVNPRMVKLRTPTATVGIRGTVFDIVCGPTSSPDSASEAQLDSMPCDQSLFVSTRGGTVVLNGETGEELLLSEGQNGRVNAAQTSARMLDAAPEYFKTLSTPQPESISANLDQLFGAQVPDDQGSGVYVTVHEGRVLLGQSNSELTLDAGESAFAGQSLVPVKLFNAPSVLDRDPFLSSGKFATNMCRR